MADCCTPETRDISVDRVANKVWRALDGCGNKPRPGATGTAGDALAFGLPVASTGTHGVWAPIASLAALQAAIADHEVQVGVAVCDKTLAAGDLGFDLIRTGWVQGADVLEALGVADNNANRVAVENALANTNIYLEF